MSFRRIFGCIKSWDSLGSHGIGHHSYLRLIAAGLLLAACFGLAEVKQFSPPKTFHANTYPAHDAHENEKFSVAADPYDMADKAAIFKVHYRNEGFLPIHVIFSNDGDQPVFMDGMQARLITYKRVKIEPSTPEDLFRRIAHAKQRVGEPGRINFPLPRKMKRTISAEAENEIQSAQLRVPVVEPHSTVSGFLFFDISGVDNPLAGATLFVSGLHSGDAAKGGKELWYFEVPMEKYLTYQPPLK